MSFTLEVENIKCGGCASSIKKGLLAIAGVEDVEVDIEGGFVHLDALDEVRENVVTELKRMGYPENGSVSGFDSVSAKAKSFVSCAVGRMDGDKV